jgi:hypothetical protein
MAVYRRGRRRGGRLTKLDGRKLTRVVSGRYTVEQMLRRNVGIVMRLRERLVQGGKSVSIGRRHWGIGSV